MVWRVSQRLSNLLDGFVKALIELDEGIRGPERLLQLFARDHFTRSVEQQGQNLKRLILEHHLPAPLVQLRCRKIDFEQAEANFPEIPLRSVQDAPSIWSGL